MNPDLRVICASSLLQVKIQKYAPAWELSSACAVSDWNGERHLEDVRVKVYRSRLFLNFS